MSQKFSEINWAEVAFWARLKFNGLDKHGAWFYGETHWGFIQFLVSDNGGEVNISGLNVELPAISIPYTASIGPEPDAMALAHRLDRYLQNDFQGIDWNWTTPKKEHNCEDVFAKIK